MAIVLDVFTDLEPWALNRVGLEIYRRWVEFAMGMTSLGNDNPRTLAHPTGRYASSISFHNMGPTHVAIIAEESLAIEAAILETGHGAVDLKQKLIHGRAYPMHRGYAQTMPAVFNTSLRAWRRNVWGRVRASGATGYARVGDTGWIIPAMPAYAPAHYYANLVRRYWGR